MRFVNRMNRFDRLYFHDNAILDHQIDSISDFKLLAFVNYGKSDLRCHTKSPAPKLMSEARLVGTLEEAGPRTE